MSNPSSLRALASWFERQKRVLPWRDEPSLYRVWVSEIMLQQTQVITVIPYFEKFMGRFTTVEDLAQASVDEVMLYWAGLGYYSRARNLHRGAQMIVAAGKPGRPAFPRTRTQWLDIPGVGEYTAGAILSIALDEPEAILDGNVERVLSRVHALSRAGGDAAYKTELWRLSKEAVKKGNALKIRPSVLNQALMELGATVCTPKKPLCLLCPLAKNCQAHQAGAELQYPPKKKPKQWIEKNEELHCLIDAEGRVLLRQRAPGEWRAGLWDLLDVEPKAVGHVKAKRIGSVESKHIVTRHKIKRVTHVYKVASAAKLSAASDGAAWIAPDAPTVAVGSALRRSLQMIRERFPEAGL